jgi:hypothetical protein
MPTWFKWIAAFASFCAITFVLSALTQAHYLVVMAASLIGGGLWFREEFAEMEAENRRAKDARDSLKKAEIIREYEADRRSALDRELARGMPRKD